jgi:hypothetical protein
MRRFKKKRWTLWHMVTSIPFGLFEVEGIVKDLFILLSFGLFEMEGIVKDLFILLYTCGMQVWVPK